MGELVHCLQQIRLPLRSRGAALVLYSSVDASVHSPGRVLPAAYNVLADEELRSGIKEFRSVPSPRQRDLFQPSHAHRIRRQSSTAGGAALSASPPRATVGRVLLLTALPRLACSDWPTVPQLYVDGEFVGGCDIIRCAALPPFFPQPPHGHMNTVITRTSTRILIAATAVLLASTYSRL